MGTSRDTKGGFEYLGGREMWNELAWDVATNEDFTGDPPFRMVNKKPSFKKKHCYGKEGHRCHGKEEHSCHGKEEHSCHGKKEHSCHGKKEHQCHGKKEHQCHGKENSKRRGKAFL